jgi:hypothetical protein
LLLVADRQLRRRFITDSQPAQNKVLSQQDAAYAEVGNLSNSTKGEKPLLSDNGEALSEHAAMGDRFAVVSSSWITTDAQRLQDLSE